VPKLIAEPVGIRNRTPALERRSVFSLARVTPEGSWPRLHRIPALVRATPDRGATPQTTMDGKVGCSRNEERSSWWPATAPEVLEGGFGFLAVKAAERFSKDIGRRDHSPSAQFLVPRDLRWLGAMPVALSAEKKAKKAGWG